MLHANPSQQAFDDIFKLKVPDKSTNLDYIGITIENYNNLSNIHEKYAFLINLIFELKPSILKKKIEAQQHFIKWCYEENLLKKVKLLHFQCTYFSSENELREPIEEKKLVEMLGELSLKIKKDFWNHFKIFQYRTRINYYYEQFSQKNFQDNDKQPLFEDIFQLKNIVFEEMVHCEDLSRFKILEKFFKELNDYFYTGFSAFHHPIHGDLLYLQSKKNIERFSLELRYALHSLNFEDFNALIEGRIKHFKNRQFAIEKLSSGTALVYLLSINKDKVIVKVYQNDEQTYPQIISALETVRKVLGEQASKLIGENYLCKKIYTVRDGIRKERGTIEVVEYMKNGNLASENNKFCPTFNSKDRTFRKLEILNRKILIFLYAKKILEMIQVFEDQKCCVPDIKLSNLFLSDNTNPDTDELFCHKNINIKFIDAKSIRFCESFPLILSTELFVTEKYVPPEIDTNNLHKGFLIDMRRWHRYQLALVLVELVTDPQTINKENQTGIDLTHPMIVKLNIKPFIETLLNPDISQISLPEMIKKLDIAYQEAHAEFKPLLEKTYKLRRTKNNNKSHINLNKNNNDNAVDPGEKSNDLIPEKTVHLKQIDSKPTNTISMPQQQSLAKLPIKSQSAYIPKTNPTNLKRIEEIDRKKNQSAPALLTLSKSASTFTLSKARSTFFYQVSSTTVNNRQPSLKNISSQLQSRITYFNTQSLSNENSPKSPTKNTTTKFRKKI